MRNTLKHAFHDHRFLEKLWSPYCISCCENDVGLLYRNAIAAIASTVKGMLVVNVVLASYKAGVVYLTPRGLLIRKKHHLLHYTVL